MNHAYYINIKKAHFWQFIDRPMIDADSFSFVPDTSWNNDPDVGYQQYDLRWFFIGYAADGYTKLASIPTPEAASGDPQNFDYEGPFHWLIWENDPENNYPPYALKIVKTDDGRIYLPIPPPRMSWADQIGVLEPGRGYFLGFLCDSTDTMTFEGWGDCPNWRNNSLPPDSKLSQPSIASARHFLFKKYTHWFYPIIIDTIDQNECPMALGDEIAVFDGDLCVGASVYEGKFPLIIAAWKDDIATPEVRDGYITGGNMRFIWHDLSENREVELIAPPLIAAEDDDIMAPRRSGFGYGFYAIRSFMNGGMSVRQLPLQFRLCHNYPNPFNAETVIPLELPERSRLKVDIYNIRGQHLGKVFEGIKEAGWPKIRYNAAELASGVYFCRVEAEALNGKG